MFKIRSNDRKFIALGGRISRPFGLHSEPNQDGGVREPLYHMNSMQKCPPLFPNGEKQGGHFCKGGRGCIFAWNSCDGQAIQEHEESGGEDEPCEKGDVLQFSFQIQISSEVSAKYLHVGDY